MMLILLTSIILLHQKTVIFQFHQHEPIIFTQIECNGNPYFDLKEIIEAFPEGIKISKEKGFLKITMNEKSAYLLDNSMKIVTERTYNMGAPFMFSGYWYCIPLDGLVKLLSFFMNEDPEVTTIDEPEPQSFTGVLDLPKTRSENKLRIVVDAGHGGDDTGTRSDSGLMEKDLTLDIALALGELLEEKGFEVIYTRTDDITLPLPHRVAIINSSDAHLLISIHANSSKNLHARGLEVYFLNSTGSDEEANELAIRENAGYKIDTGDAVVNNIIRDLDRARLVLLGKELAEQVYFSAEEVIETRRGVKQAPFYILSGAKIPGVLVEVGFMSNEEESALLEVEEYREKVAEVIFNGLNKFVIEKGGLLYAEKR